MFRRRNVYTILIIDKLIELTQKLVFQTKVRLNRPLQIHLLLPFRRIDHFLLYNEYTRS